VLDQDVPKRILLKYPSLYKPCQQNVFFNNKVFWAWVLYGIFNSAILYWFSVGIYENSVTHFNGQVDGFWYESVTIYTFAVVVVNLKIALEIKTWTWISHLTVWGSILLWIVFVFIMCSYNSSQIFNVASFVFSSPVFYFALGIVTSVCLLPDIIFKYVKRTYWPDSDHIAQELGKIELDGEVKKAWFF